MTQHFKQTIQDLWQLAELGQPRFAPDGSTSLIFDDVDLTLALSPNEQELLVSADVGSISDATSAHAASLQNILGLGFAFLATHNVLVALQGDRLTVSSNYPFRTQNISQLSELLSDVVSATQTVAAQMHQKRSSSPRVGQATDAQADEMMIFQP